MDLPDEGAAVSFAADIKGLFRESDRESMTSAFDLWSYEDVKAHAQPIVERLRAGTMPCDGALACREDRRLSTVDRRRDDRLAAMPFS